MASGDGPAVHRIAVTGASGFVGRALVRQLLDSGHAVVPLSRRRQGLAGAPGPLANYDPDAIAAQIAGCQALVHLAAVAHQAGTAGRSDATFAPNLAATRAAAEACVRAGVRRLVLVSSIGVNGVRTSDRPFTEEDPPRPAEPYAASKWACEQAAAELAQRHGLELVVVRPPLVHGPQAPGNFGALWRAVAAGRPLPLGAIDNRRSLVGVDNLAHLLLRCAIDPRAAGQLFLAADGDDVSTPDLVRHIAAALGRPARLFPVPVPLLQAAAFLAGRGAAAQRLAWSLQVDISKARKVLGWQPPYTLTEGLARSARVPTMDTPA